MYKYFKIIFIKEIQFRYNFNAQIFTNIGNLNYDTYNMYKTINFDGKNLLTCISVLKFY